MAERVSDAIRSSRPWSEALDNPSGFFEEELIKGDLAFAQETDIRDWMREVLTNPDPLDDLDSTQTFVGQRRIGVPEQR